MKRLVFFIILIAAVNCFSKDIIVDADGGGNFTIIQDAIDAASYGDNIIVADGHYRGVGNYDLVLNGIGITVQSENGPENCIINPESSGRGFYLVHEDPNSVIRGFTIKNGYCSGTDGGGGIYIHNSLNILVENCIVEDCSALNGAGISIWVSYATVRDCIIQANSAVHSAAMAHGGGMYLMNCFGLVVDSCHIVGNHTSGEGGGIYMNDGTVDFNDSVIQSNRADSTTHANHGGGIMAETLFQLNITNCKLIDNYCGYYGAALHLATGGNTVVTNSLLEGNYTAKTGGGIYNFGSTLDIVNCTIVKNRSDIRAGGCFLGANTTYSTVCNLRNSILWQNTAIDGPEFYINGSASGITTMNYSYNDFDQTGIYNNLGVLNDLGGNIYADPNFASEGYDNSGNWVAGDYHLKSKVGRYVSSTSSWVTDSVDSPCIDAADPADSVDYEPYPHGNRANIGFYGRSAEASKSPTCSAAIPADLTNDCRVDLGDLSMFASYWLDCNIDPPQFCWQ